MERILPIYVGPLWINFHALAQSCSIFTTPISDRQMHVGSNQRFLRNEVTCYSRCIAIAMPVTSIRLTKYGQLSHITVGARLKPLMLYSMR